MFGHSSIATKVRALTIGLLMFASDRQVCAIDFESDVRPILAERCWQCHNAKEQNGGLRLDDNSAIVFAGAQSTTDSGQAAIVPGQPQRSALLRRIVSSNEEDRMPPEGPRLSDQQIATLTKWIANGAQCPNPAQKGTGAASPLATGNPPHSDAKGLPLHWAFQPLATSEQLRQSVQLQDPTWGWNGVDIFIQLERERRKLRVANDSAPHALARRVAYTLTGLPPSAEQIDAFVQTAQRTGDTRAAQTTLVDELLSSPAYGERGGRHWLDWVRYADTAGDTSDYPIPKAYLYRIYV